MRGAGSVSRERSGRASNLQLTSVRTAGMLCNFPKVFSALRRRIHVPVRREPQLAELADRRRTGRVRAQAVQSTGKRPGREEVVARVVDVVAVRAERALVVGGGEAGRADTRGGVEAGEGAERVLFLFGGGGIATFAPAGAGRPSRVHLDAVRSADTCTVPAQGRGISLEAVRIDPPTKGTSTHSRGNADRRPAPGRRPLVYHRTRTPLAMPGTRVRPDLRRRDSLLRSQPLPPIETPRAK